MPRATVLLALVLVFPAFAQPPVDLGNVTEKAVMIPMRDGVRLSAYLYFPPGAGPWPVLYEQRYADLRGAATRQNYARLAAAGFVVAAQNFRGAGKSEGTWVGYRALGWGRQRDGYDTVEWLAGQPWSTGKVGTFGSSQAGFAQNFLAVTRPPHLVCQYMIDTGLSLFHEGYRIGGTTRPERFKAMDTVCRDPADNRRLLAEWFGHPTYDAYWADEDCTRFIDRMDVPCFTVGSWYDFMCVGSVDSFIGRQHRGGPNSRGRQQLVLGPWPHGGAKDHRVGDLTYPISAKFAMTDHMVRWFDHHLKGVDNGVHRLPTVRYYTMGAVGEPDAPGNNWHGAADWPVYAENVSYYLRADGRLTNEAPTEDAPPTRFRADPLRPNTIPGRAFLGAKDARPFEAQAEVRTFTSEVLTDPVEWTGKVRAELFVTSSARDTDFIVRVSDVYPDGRSILLMDYVRRARYRDGYEKEILLEPGKVARVAFDVGWTSQIFNKGHRIRVAVASTGAPFYEPNPNTGAALTLEPPAETRVAENAVHHERRHASRVIAPVRPLPGPEGAALLAPHYRPPPALAKDLGAYRSPLRFNDDSPVKTAADWTRRRKEILDTWHGLMGAWPPVLEKPRLEYLSAERRDRSTQHRVRLEVAPGRTTEDAYLLVPDGNGRGPAVVVVYYDAATGVGLGKAELRDYAYQLARRGFVALSLGSPPNSHYPDKERSQMQPLSFHAYVAANAYQALANHPRVDPARVGIVGHSYGGKWAMFASCLFDKFACGVWSDGGVVFDERRPNVNYWEPWYLGHEPGVERKPGVPRESNPRTGAYRRMMETGRDLHELHALMAPRPFLVSGGSEDPPERWRALNHAVAVNRLLGHEHRVAMTNRPGHNPTVTANAAVYAFFEEVLRPGR